MSLPSNISSTFGNDTYHQSPSSSYAVTASFAQTASFLVGGAPTPNYAFTSSYLTTASFDAFMDSDTFSVDDEGNVAVHSLSVDGLVPDVSLWETAQTAVDNTGGLASVNFALYQASEAESSAISYAQNNCDPAGSANTVESNAQSYTDSECSGVQYNAESYADNSVNNLQTNLQNGSVTVAVANDANYASSAGNASQATYDGNGNQISSTYLPIAGTNSDAVTTLYTEPNTANGIVTKDGNGNLPYLTTSSFNSATSSLHVAFATSASYAPSVTPNYSFTSSYLTTSSFNSATSSFDLSGSATALLISNNVWSGSNTFSGSVILGSSVTTPNTTGVLFPNVLTITGGTNHAINSVGSYSGTAISIIGGLSICGTANGAYNGGIVTITGGTNSGSSTPSSAPLGGAVNINGGASSIFTGSSTGGSVNIFAGASTNGTTNTGGSVTIRGGSGATANGLITIGDQSTSAINIGSGSMLVAITGSFNLPNLNQGGFVYVNSGSGTVTASYSVQPVNVISGSGTTVSISAANNSGSTTGGLAGNLNLNAGSFIGNALGGTGGNINITAGNGGGGSTNTAGSINITSGYATGSSGVGGSINIQLAANAGTGGSINIGTNTNGTTTIGNSTTGATIPKIICSQIQVVGNSGTQIFGTTTANTPTAGNLGQVISSYVPSSSLVPLTSSAAPFNVTSISLTAGDWDIEGAVNYVMTSATVTQFEAGLSTGSLALPTNGTEVFSGTQYTTTTAKDSITIPRKQNNFASATTVYLVAQSNYSTGSVSAYGQLYARRIR